MATDLVPPVAQPDALTDVLRRACELAEGRVREVSVLTSRNTLISRVMRLRVAYDGDGGSAPATLFVKTSRPDGPIGWRVGRQEVAFYRDVATSTPPGLLPRCYDAEWREDTKAWHLLLEDLTETHAVATPWPVPPSEEQCARQIETRARFAAAWWDDPRLGRQVGTLMERDALDRVYTEFADQFARFADRLGDGLSRERRTLSSVCSPPRPGCPDATSHTASSRSSTATRTPGTCSTRRRRGVRTCVCSTGMAGASTRRATTSPT